MQAHKSILIVDTDSKFYSSIKSAFISSEFDFDFCDCAETAIEKIENKDFDLILTEHKLPQMTGLEFLQNFQARSIVKNIKQTAIILMSSGNNSDLALKAIAAGAIDYLDKPFTANELRLNLQKAIIRQDNLNQKIKNREIADKKYNFNNIVAQSKIMLDIFETVKRLANFNTTVLISGESGTGKELLARAIHDNSARKNKPFIAINCGAIPENLIESELFGHKKGAFTDAVRDKKGLFEEANGGTIFLDEIAELPSHLQVKLLRVLQERKIRPVGEEQTADIDVRVLAASHKDLEEEVLNNNFRDDLFFRLNVVAMHIPALRERTEDIPVLIDFFLNKIGTRLGFKIEKIDAGAMQALLKYNWRGNVRELENCIERALVLCESDTITIDCFPECVKNYNPNQKINTASAPASGNLSIKEHSRAIEINLINQALKQTGGNRTHAAKLLEISHRTLLYKLKEYAIE